MRELIALALQLHDNLQLLEKRKFVHNVHLNVGARGVTIARDCKKSKRKKTVLPMAMT